MRVYEIITESKKIEEGPILDKVGKAIGKGVGATAKGVGAVAGGAVGAWQAMKKGYQAGKSAVSGDMPTPDTGDYGKVSKDGSKIWNKKAQQWEPYNQEPASTQSAGSSASQSSATKMSLTQIKQASDSLRTRDKQSLVSHLQKSLDAVKSKQAPAAKPVATAPAASPTTSAVKIAGKKAPAARPKTSVAV